MTAERYTVVFTGLLERKESGEHLYMGRDGAVWREQLSGETSRREISFSGLPEKKQRLVPQPYRELWDL
ncbi:MAG: hypothetical protein ACR2HO_09680 [Rubrobacteraceae bacterium]|nr:hypothetical protein [Rubrobacter sp.]